MRLNIFLCSSEICGSLEGFCWLELLCAFVGASCDFVCVCCDFIMILL